MTFNFLEKLQEVAKKTIEQTKMNLENTEISEEEIELARKLNAMQEFSVDRLEGNIVVLENRENGEKIEIEKNKLPSNLKEGDILKCVNGKYSLEKEKTQNETERIKNKMNKLWN